MSNAAQTSSPPGFTNVLSRQTRWLAALYGVSLVGIVVFTNLIAYQHPWRWDTTASQRYSLDPRSERALERIAERLRASSGEPVEITTLFSPQTAASPDEAAVTARLQARVELVCELFAQRCDVRWRRLDPYIDRDAVEELAQRFAGARVSDTVIIARADRYRLIKRHQLADFDVSRREVRQFKVETAILRALDDLSRPTGAQRPRIGVTQGSGEPEFDGELAELRAMCAAEGFELVACPAHEALPAELAALIIAGPRNDLDVLQAAQFTRYLAAGGRVLAVVPPSATPRPRLERLLEQAGLKLLPRLVLFKGQLRLRAAHVHAAHPITLELPASQPVELSSALALGQTSTPPLELDDHALVVGDGEGWHHIPADARAGVAYRFAADAPYVLARALRWPVHDREARLVCIGSSATISREALQQAGSAGRALVYNSLGWLLDREELITDRLHDPRYAGPLLLQEPQQQLLKLLVVAVPVLCFCAGVFIWLLRKD
jgi:hypothetical protein